MTTRAEGIFFVTSSEVLMTSGTGYSMPAHLALNAIWLWLYSRPESRAFYLAPLVGTLAIGKAGSKNAGLIAAAGSTLGCYVLDLIVRKRGGAGIRKILSAKRLEYVEKKVENRAAAALLVATLAPPPFPFTTVIAAVSALHYPRGKMLGVIAVGRTIRFTIIGLLALWLGRHFLRITETPAFEWSMAGFIALCAVGSAISIYKWVHSIRPA